jgi:hypothetical protein
MKKFIIRSILVLAVVLLFITLLFTGKGHTLLLDNKSIVMGGLSFEPTGSVTVTVDGKKPVKLAPNERDLVVVKGVWHTIKVATDTTSLEKKFTLPFKDMFIVSIPALFGGNQTWFEDKKTEESEQKPAQTGTEEAVPTGGESLPL